MPSELHGDSETGVDARSGYSLPLQFTQLTALYIDEDGKLSGEKAKEQICQWLPAEVTSRCSIEPMVKSGNAAEQIVSVANEGDYDLLVFGAEQRSFLRAILFGTTTEALLRSSPIPMLVVPKRN
ncbi:MAG: universal stress protein [Armatimonadota bacterium]|nr:universal stress protein [Armatimonadota bacterium]